MSTAWTAPSSTSRPSSHCDQPPRHDVAHGEHEERDEDEQSVGRRVEQLTEPAGLVQATGQHAVQPVGCRRDGQDRERREVVTRERQHGEHRHEASRAAEIALGQVSTRLEATSEPLTLPRPSVPAHRAVRRPRARARDATKPRRHPDPTVPRPGRGPPPRCRCRHAARCRRPDRLAPRGEPTALGRARWRTPCVPRSLRALRRRHWVPRVEAVHRLRVRRLGARAGACRARPTRDPLGPGRRARAAGTARCAAGGPSCRSRCRSRAPGAVDGRVPQVGADRGGYLDAVIPADLPPGWHEVEIGVDGECVSAPRSW